VDSNIWPATQEGEIYFEISVNGVKEKRIPSSGSWQATIGTLYSGASDSYLVINVPDNSQIHTINIAMYDDDTISQEVLDIDGHDNTMGLTLYYDIVLHSWTGDDTSGISDGSNDGTASTDDNDAYLEYSIQMI
jgi:hypothetical protein